MMTVSPASAARDMATRIINELEAVLANSTQELQDKSAFARGHRVALDQALAIARKARENP